MTKKFESSMVGLTGIVIPSLWDEDDHVVAVSLAADDDHQYLIENGEKFMKIIGRQIRAKGILKIKHRTQRAIQIKKYDLIESSYT
jgi:hypothetical protein